MEEIENDIHAYARLSGDSKQIVGRRLLMEGEKIDQEIKKAAAWLTRNWDRRDDYDWIEGLREYERLCDIREDIRRAIQFG